MDTSQFNGSFWIAIAGAVSGFVVVIITAINKSKCSNVNCCWGLFNCIRDVKIEEEIELQQVKVELPKKN